MNEVLTGETETFRVLLLLLLLFELLKLTALVVETGLDFWRWLSGVVPASLTEEDCALNALVILPLLSFFRSDGVIPEMSSWGRGGAPSTFVIAVAVYTRSDYDPLTFETFFDWVSDICGKPFEL